jgi:hypothetical protein
VLPPEHLPLVQELAGRTLAELEQRGVQVVGDLDDLVPAAPSGSGHPDAATEAEVAEAAVWALHEVLLRLEEERVRHQEEEARLRAVLTWRLRGALRLRSRLAGARLAWGHRPWAARQQAPGPPSLPDPRGATATPPGA